MVVVATEIAENSENRKAFLLGVGDTARVEAVATLEEKSGAVGNFFIVRYVLNGVGCSYSPFGGRYGVAADRPVAGGLVQSGARPSRFE
jgi:hypothetical protein